MTGFTAFRLYEGTERPDGRLVDMTVDELPPGELSLGGALTDAGPEAASALRHPFQRSRVGMKTGASSRPGIAAGGAGAAVGGLAVSHVQGLNVAAPVSDLETVVESCSE
jgi:hypothetical protein